MAESSLRLYVCLMLWRQFRLALHLTYSNVRLSIKAQRPISVNSFLKIYDFFAGNNDTLSKRLSLRLRMPQVGILFCNCQATFREKHKKRASVT